MSKSHDTMFSYTPFNPDKRKKLKYRINTQAIRDRFGKDTADYVGVMREITAAFAELSKLGLFEFAPVKSDSEAFDIFVSFGPIDGKDDRGIENNTVGVTTFLRGKTPFGDNFEYAQVQMDIADRWRLTDKSIFKWSQRKWPRLLHWLLHELLHALGCGHTEERFAQQFESIMDQNHWGSDRITLPPWDQALVMKRHKKRHPYEVYL